MARRRFGIFKRASQEGEEGTAVHPLATATAEHDPVEETGDFEPVGETGEFESGETGETGDYKAAGETGDYEALGETGEYSAFGETGDHEAVEDDEPDAERELEPIPPLEPEGTVSERIRRVAEAAAREAGEVQTDEVAVLEQKIEEAGENAAGGLAESERRVAAAEQRACEAERIAHQAERRAQAAEARASALEQRLAELEVAAEKDETGRVQGAPGSSADAIAEELAELRAQVEDEARSAASRWLRGQLDAARETAEVRQAQAVEAARDEVERETLERVAASSDDGAQLVADAHAEEVRKLREELTEAHDELERARANPAHTNGNGHDPAVDEARAQAEEAQARAERAEHERVEAEKRASSEGDETAEAKLNELRAELEAVRAELADRSPEAARRIEEKLVAARRAAEDTLATELRVRTAQLDHEREARLQAAEAAEERLRTVEQRAIEAAERIAIAERFVKSEQHTPPAGQLALGGTAVAVATAQISVSEATYSELLSSGMSVAQAKRVLRRRAEHGPFTSLDQLDELAEFAPRAGDELRSRLVP